MSRVHNAMRNLVGIVTPAQAGVQTREKNWIPAFAGMTVEDNTIRHAFGRPDDRRVTMKTLAATIAAILLLGPALDAKYAASKANALEWKDGRPVIG